MLSFVFESKNLILGVVPETLGMFLFGLVLVVLAIGLRWVIGDDHENFADKEPVNMLLKESNDGAGRITEDFIVTEN